MVGNRLRGSGQIAEYADGNHAWSLMSKEPRELFNRTLTEAGVPLAKK